ncbi:MAG: hypothetical protein D8M57_03210 [Candidatus Scalindua sp. AMX11]|nr:MAG: hypothetical protein DWQ00_16780 [Candidatus Scalindua sp.]NOG85875.1 hypothetical protein [Planctomycetota bacterium]RZV96953.1 MAG: hypothetical protein EX341_01860 [Candidatus Scalindua sp. SCAELEC01]TDE66435.1 MAG: hypothetical protein D8M57_03210 [Candidatus Scalindua sp. AMX11]
MSERSIPEQNVGPVRMVGRLGGEATKMVWSYNIDLFFRPTVRDLPIGRVVMGVLTLHNEMIFHSISE